MLNVGVCVCGRLGCSADGTLCRWYSVMLHCDTQPDFRLAMPPYLSKQMEPALQPKLGTPATFISCSD